MIKFINSPGKDGVGFIYDLKFKKIDSLNTPSKEDGACAMMVVKYSRAMVNRKIWF